MDARNDPNDNDRRNIEDMKTQQFCSAEGFNDTLEEIEMLWKYGKDYPLRCNDKECPDMTEKQTVCPSVSSPNKSLYEMSEFEDFGEGINEGENHHHGDDTETYSENHSGGCARSEISTLAVSHKNHEPSSCGVVCGYDKTVSVGKAHDNLCVKPQSMPFGKFHNKLKAVVSPTVNVKLCQTVRNDKASPFKIPVESVPHASSIPKLIAVRDDKKSSLKPTTVVTPGKRPLNYKKIVSPVGAYIHNIPTPSLVTTVKPILAHAGIPKRMMVDREAAVMSRPAALSKIEQLCVKSPLVLEQRGRENVDTNNIQPLLPVVSYKSVPSLKLEQSQKEKMPHLNERMKKLVNTPKPHVVRHEGRVKVTSSSHAPNVKVSSVMKLVADCDDSCVASSDADAEISVVVRREVARTHTLGV